MSSDGTKSNGKFLTWDSISLLGGRQENQDYYGFCRIPDGGCLFVVCDGMGGMRGGSTASKEAVRIIIEEANAMQETNPERILTNAFKKANTYLFHLGQTKEELRGLGTTAAVLLINVDKATVAHVGDSRVYQLRGKNKVFRTFDHSLVFDLVKQGSLTEEQARLSADSNIINRALGMKPDVEVEITDHLAYRKGDRFMLCSDGISGMVKERKLLKMISKGKEVKETVKKLTYEIDDIGNKSGGGHDNMTTILIELFTNSTLKWAKKRKLKKKYWVMGIIMLLSLLALIGLALYKLYYNCT